MKAKKQSTILQEAKWIEQFGYFVHYVPPAKDEFFVNIHTHGVRETTGHTDLQVVMPISPPMANKIFGSLFNAIREGRHFYDGLDYDVHGNRFRMKLVPEGDRLVLRVLLPDQNGVFGVGANYPFSEQ